METIAEFAARKCGTGSTTADVMRRVVVECLTEWEDARSPVAGVRRVRDLCAEVGNYVESYAGGRHRPSFATIEEITDAALVAAFRGR